VGIIGAGLAGAGFGFAAGAVCAADVRGTAAASKTTRKIPETDGALKTPARLVVRFKHSHPILERTHANV
jgi:hypothetical protein